MDYIERNHFSIIVVKVLLIEKKVCKLYIEKNWKRCEKNGNVSVSFLTKDIANGKADLNLKIFSKKPILEKT